MQFHDEYELTLILASGGTWMVGDHINRFEKGDLIFIGKELPHTWKNDQEQPHIKPEALVIHFGIISLVTGFFMSPI